MPEIQENKYGLKRHIPEGVAREVRQRCGFGCVKCGLAIYQYEHVDPVFSEARVHDPEAIVLLCGGCHDLVTRGLLSKETVKRYSLNPACKAQGFSFGPFDLGFIAPTISIGGFRATGLDTLIRVMGDDIISIKPPEFEGGPFLINAFLSDREGNVILKIVDNQWITPTENWDVEVVGQKITIRKKLGDIVLVLRSTPPHSLIIERLEMFHKGIRISGREQQYIEVAYPDGHGFVVRDIEIDGGGVGIDITRDGPEFGIGSGSVKISQGTFGPIARPLERNDIHHFPLTNSAPRRNEKCACGSGARYKNCCGVIR